MKKYIAVFLLALMLITSLGLTAIAEDYSDIRCLQCGCSKWEVYSESPLVLMCITCAYIHEVH